MSSSGGGSIEEELENTNRYARNLRKYARNRGLTREAKNSIFKETRRLGKVARNIRSKHKRAPQPKPLTQEHISAWREFRRKDIQPLPVYYIACHGATCSSYGQCGAPELDTTPPTTPKIGLPPNTFMINLVNGELCQAGRLTELILMNKQEDFKNALFVDSPNDSERAYNPTRESPILSGIHRSSPGSLYPNYICSFEKTAVRMGVFNLSLRDEHGKATLVYFPTGEEEKKPIFISDILRKVNTSSGPGIYILAACAGPYSSNEASIRSNDYSTLLVRNNELEYTSKYPTLSIAQIKSFDPTFSMKDPGKTYAIGIHHPILTADLALQLGEHPSTILPENNKFLNETVGEYNKMKGNKYRFTREGKGGTGRKARRKSHRRTRKLT